MVVVVWEWATAVKRKQWIRKAAKNWKQFLI
jgi:hypothetical protein